MALCGIYKITNLLNGRVYYGSSVNIERRKREHFGELKNNKHGNLFLQRDFNKCGGEGFLFQVVLYCDEFNLEFYEQRFLDKYWDEQVNCYNIFRLAGSTTRGMKLSEEHKKKISESNKGRKHSDETRRKLSQASKGHKRWLGKTHSEETKSKIGAYHRGKIISEEHRRSASEKLKGRPSHLKGKKLSEEHKKKLREAKRKLPSPCSIHG